MLRSFRVAMTAAASLLLLAAGQAPDQNVTATTVPEPQVASYTEFMPIEPAAPALAVQLPEDETLDAPAAAAPTREGSLRQLVDAMAELPSLDLSDEMRCLATAVYYESKGEPLEGQLAVAQVIMNRVESGRYRSNICGVVTQPGQFSFVRGGRLVTPRESQNWRTAQAVAVIAATENWREIVGEATSFHATRVAPGWRGMRRVSQIGNHIFYAAR